MKKSVLFVVLFVGVAVGACGSSGGSASGGALATLDDFCDKCATCVVTPGFSEGFCTPWIGAQGGSFDRLACSSKGDTSQLANQNVTAATVAGWTCEQFDKNE